MLSAPIYRCAFGPIDDAIVRFWPIAADCYRPTAVTCEAN
jgi:hypothetical protein